MNILHGLETLLGAGARGAGQAVQGAERALGVGQPQGQGLPMGQGIGQAMQQAGRPDFTYNPNPNSNIPNSSHNLQQVMAANGRMQLHPQQQGIPMRGPINIQQGAAGLQVQNNPSLQGGQFNPGFTPLQNSGFGGPGYANNLQGPAANPQIRDMDPFWNGQ